MNQLTHITSLDGVRASNGYRHDVVGAGRLVAIPGQVALDCEGPATSAVRVAAAIRPESPIEVEAFALVPHDRAGVDAARQASGS